MVGKRFGRLKVISDQNKTKHESAIWLCKCDCGTLVEIEGRSLRFGSTKSCGCLQKEVTRQMGLNHKKHGDKSIRNPARLYITWISMKDRCYNPKEPAFKYYGGKGIKVCSEWLTNYPVFKKWALTSGYQDNLTIDRIDSNGNYCPSNCHWLTKSENAKKRWQKGYRYYQAYIEGRLLTDGKPRKESADES